MDFIVCSQIGHQYGFWSADRRVWIRGTAVDNRIIVGFERAVARRALETNNSDNSNYLWRLGWVFLEQTRIQFSVESSHGLQGISSNSLLWKRLGNNSSIVMQMWSWRGTGKHAARHKSCNLGDNEFLNKPASLNVTYRKHANSVIVHMLDLRPVVSPFLSLSLFSVCTMTWVWTCNRICNLKSCESQNKM